MLRASLTNIPPPKCILIQDSLEAQGLNVLFSMINKWLKLHLAQIHLFLFENNVDKIKDLFRYDNITIYDFTNSTPWLTEGKTGEFFNVLKNSELSGMIIIDSLAQVVFEYGLAETYKALHTLINSTEQSVLQLAAVLHEDVFEDAETVLNYFDKLSILTMKLIPMGSNMPRVDYFFKKSGGKVIKEIEEYFFTDGLFYTKTIERPDPKVLLANAIDETLPEELASFKITLNEKDKKLRDDFTLPYLKTAEEKENAGGNIIYSLDENDDWDDEDPDDDLNI